MRTNRAASALADHQFLVKEVEEVRSGRPVAAAASLSSTGSQGQYRLAPAPPPRGRAPARGRALARAAEDGGAITDEEAKNVYRLSDLPTDVAPAVSVAQALTSSRRVARGVQTSALEVVEIASTIAGVVMTRVLDNQGDVSWELDQMPRDAVHPGGASSTPGSSVWQSQRINVPGLRCENKAGQETFADFEVNFKHNGASVGFIEVSTTKTEDAWGWGLTVKETITADPNTYDTVPASGQRFAAVKLRFHFRFDHTPLQDVIGYIDLTLYGNGTFAETSRWTQP